MGRLVHIPPAEPGSWEELPPGLGFRIVTTGPEYKAALKAIQDSSPNIIPIHDTEKLRISQIEKQIVLLWIAVAALSAWIGFNGVANLLHPPLFSVPVELEKSK